MMMTRPPDLESGIVGAPAELHAESGTTAHGEAPTRVPAVPDLRRLYAFTVVAEELHFRHAANRLAMAQSPLSRMIKGLEHDVGVVLFVRTRRSVRLTRAGVSLLNDAYELLRLTERAVERARRINRGVA